MPKNDILLSIIVPMYNAEKYVLKAITSLLEQDIEDYEIIIVDDGSTDKSYDIIKTLSNKSKITIIRQENKGTNHVRNQGIQLSNGRYLMFFDSDDEFKRNSFGKIKKIVLDYDVDLIWYDTLFVEPNGVIVEKRSLNICNNSILTKENFLNIYFNDIFDASYTFNFWNKVFKKEILIKNHIKFSNNDFFVADYTFIMELLKNIKTSVYINDTFYFYKIHESSATHKYHKEFLNRITAIILEKIKYMMELSLINKNNVYALQNNWKNDIIRCINNEIISDSNAEDKIRKIEQIIASYKSIHNKLQNIIC